MYPGTQSPKSNFARHWSVVLCIRRCSVSLTRRNSIDGITAFIPKKVRNSKRHSLRNPPCILNLLPNPIHTLVPAEFFFLFRQPPIRFFYYPHVREIHILFIYLPALANVIETFCKSGNGQIRKTESREWGALI